MRFLLSSLLLTTAMLPAAPLAPQPSILENGNFDNPTDPLKGWIIDYAFEGNSNYMGNKDHVSIVTEGARKNVVKFGSAGEAGVKMECRAFPLEPGFKYVAALDMKGAGYRIYFKGYQFAPGERPHENPELSELREIYKSKPTIGSSADWKQEKIEIPGVKLSPQFVAQFKKIRYLTVYIFMAKPGFVDNVTVTKVPDPTMKF
jgi:hypothetical protein